MPAPPPPPAVEEGEFDDAPIASHTEDNRGGDNYIDDTPEQSEDISEDDDDFDSDEPDDLTRVEDEDWEIAERGTCSNPTTLYFSF
jgi:hypothetical protein